LAICLHLNRIATPLAWKLPLSQRLLARLTFGQVFYWSRPEHAISKCSEIKVVNRSPCVGLVLGGLVMGLENGPSGEPFTFAPSIDDPLLRGSLYLFAPSIDDPLLRHRSPPGGVLLRPKSHINDTIKCLSGMTSAILHPSIPKDYRGA